MCVCAQERNYHIYLNHTSLLKAILLHSGVPEDKLNQASNVLCDAMVGAGPTCAARVGVSPRTRVTFACPLSFRVFTPVRAADQARGGGEVLQLFPVDQQREYPPAACSSCEACARSRRPGSRLPCCAQLQTLYKYIEQKGSLQDLAPLLTSLTKQKTAVTQLAKQGLKDLEEVTVLLRRLGVKMQVTWVLKAAALLVSPPFNADVSAPGGH